ncbi:TraY domain-containing protein [Vibrio sp. B172a]|uniref:TraY domain-containing protein n=1 Tax=Vibrio sp. B172a TaxID=2835790 RepID=UPI002554289B|nr:TraY domain-containing protein [Vibrio sp. B172a]MDK9783766.1 TraY domain-containing protein [Vibrio sp. B172a]
MSSELKSTNAKLETGIAFKLAFRPNQVLEHSAKKAVRTKKAEAKLRLEDHLLRFPDWRP